MRFKAFCVASRGGAEKKNTKKYAKILVYQKNVVILHRGFVRAYGACSLKMTYFREKEASQTFETFKILKIND